MSVELLKGRWEEAGEWAIAHLPGDPQFCGIDKDLRFYFSGDNGLLTLTFYAYFENDEEYWYKVAIVRLDRSYHEDVCLHLILTNDLVPMTLNDFTRAVALENRSSGIARNISSQIKELRACKELAPSYEAFVGKLLAPIERGEIHDIIGYDEAILRKVDKWNTRR